MTLKELQMKAANCGFSVTKRGGEYRLTFTRETANRLRYAPERIEACAYYTSDIEDAHSTLMSEWYWLKRKMHPCYYGIARMYKGKPNGVICTGESIFEMSYIQALFNEKGDNMCIVALDANRCYYMYEGADSQRALTDAEIERIKTEVLL
jgi:hypothetical protein